MGQLVDQLGNKNPGQLIKSADWNALVAAVENIETTLDQRITDLSTKVDTQFQAVNAQITQANAQITQLQAQVNAIEPLLSQYYRVTLQATKPIFAIGEQAEIDAHVTDLQGNSLQLTNDNRPWINFISTWGLLKPSPGFDSVSSVGDHSIAVRTDLQGTAKVLLTSEHTDGFSSDAESAMATALTTKLANNLTVADTFMQAATPIEAKNANAFQTMSLEYDRSDASNTRRYLDTYYLKYITPPTKWIPPIDGFGFWRDYLTMVIAFASSDNNPLTPNPGRGASSIQVGFRDWIYPWFYLDYVDNTHIAQLVQNAGDLFGNNITSDYLGSFNNIKNQVIKYAGDSTQVGIMGKLRNYQVAQTALNQVQVAQPPSFLDTLKTSVNNAISIQQSFEHVQSSPINPVKDVAFDTFTNAATRDDIQLQASQVQQNLNTQQLQFQQSLLAEGGPVKSLVNEQVSPVQQQVVGLQALNPTTVNQQLTTLANFDSRIANIETAIQAISTPKPA